MVSPLFQFHKLNASGIVKANAVGLSFADLLEKLESICPQGREFAIVKTKLEEACFFAKKSVATQPDNQENA